MGQGINENYKVLLKRFEEKVESEDYRIALSISSLIDDNGACDFA